MTSELYQINTLNNEQEYYALTNTCQKKSKLDVESDSAVSYYQTWACIKFSEEKTLKSLEGEVLDMRTTLQNSRKNRRSSETSDKNSGLWTIIDLFGIGYSFQINIKEISFYIVFAFEDIKRNCLSKVIKVLTSRYLTFSTKNHVWCYSLTLTDIWPISEG